MRRSVTFFSSSNSATRFLARIPRMLETPIFQNRPGKTDPNTYKYQPKKIYGRHLGKHPLPANCDLGHLRSVANTRGVFTVVPYIEPNSPELHYLHAYLHGMAPEKLVYGDQQLDVTIHPFKQPGLALHPGSPESLFIYQGDENPHMSRTHTLDKWEEYCLFEKYAPGTWLPTKLVAKESWYQEDIVKRLRKQLRRQVAAGQGVISADLQSMIERFIRCLISNINQMYPEGGYLKHVLGCYTIDSDTVFATKKTDAAKLAQQFINTYNSLIDHDEASIRQELLNRLDNRPLIIFECLYRPRNVIFTPHVDFDKTVFDEPIEVRVDALRWNPIAVWPRHSPETFEWDAMQKAMHFIQTLGQRLPPRYQEMSFGADVVFVNGEPRIPDINPGGDSGFLKIALQYQVFVSNLTRQKAPLVLLLEQVSKQPLSVQHDFLHGLPETILAHPEVADIEETAIYLRNLHLMQWCREGADLQAAEKCLYDLHQIFRANLLTSWIDSEKILAAAEFFFDSKKQDHTMLLGV